MSSVNDEVLKFAMEAISVGTLLESMELQIKHKDMQGRCNNCSLDFDITLDLPKCPQCDSEDFELLPDPPLLLEQIEFDVEK